MPSNPKPVVQLCGCTTVQMNNMFVVSRVVDVKPVTVGKCVLKRLMFWPKQAFSTQLGLIHYSVSSLQLYSCTTVQLHNMCVVSLVVYNKSFGQNKRFR